jgi:glucose/arabinose dehydrogenase
MNVTTALRRLAVLSLCLGLAACGERATLPVMAGYGPNPILPPPQRSLLPTVLIAPAVGWLENETPMPAPGLRVQAFARGLDHPRWLYVLPNGDVLVAESAAPPREGGGLIAWIRKQFMKWAGAAVPSANRITLLRDGDGDGVAEARFVLIEGLNSPFGMALRGEELFVANTDAIVRFPYRTGDTRITAPATQITELPAGPINYHWTRNMSSAWTASACMRPWAPTATSPSTA